jgi:hypothetical protein
MHSIARIRFGDQALVMPARSAYERELVFEQVELHARRHGAVRLELDRRQMLISAVRSEPRPCSECGRHESPPSFRFGHRPLCRRCLRTL